MIKIVITTLFILLVTVSAMGEDTGYLVAVQDNLVGERKIVRTQSADTVSQKIAKHTGIEVDVEKLFAGGKVYFEFRSNDILLYVEKKKVETKADGEEVYLKLSKKDLKRAQ